MLDIDLIVREMSIQYSIDDKNIKKIIVETISKVYNSLLPVIIEDNGVHAAYHDEKLDGYKFVKLTLSKKRQKEIVSLIQKKAILFNLNRIKDSAYYFIKTKRGYFHSKYSYTKDSHDYYDLYYDKRFLKPVRSTIALVPTSHYKKSRIYVDYSSFETIDTQQDVVCREHKKYINMKNIRLFTKEVCVEIYEKYQRKVWITILDLKVSKRTIYISVHQRINLEVTKYIKVKYHDVFGLDVEFIILNTIKV